jgi:hypothetical protein
MNRTSVLPLTAALLSLVVLSPAAHAACNFNTADTGADSALTQSGQGNLSCSDFIGQPDPLSPLLSSPMMEITGLAGVSTSPIGGSSIDFSIAPDSGYSADVVIVEAADGRRCIYNYGGDTLDGTNLTPAGDKSVKSVTICSDGVSSGTLSPPLRVPIATDTAKACTGGSGANLQDGVNNDDDIALVIGFGEGPDGAVVAVCADKEDGGASNDALLTQCQNTCERPANFVEELDQGASGVGPYSAECANDLAAATLAPGELPLSCRSCELSSALSTSQAGTNDYCWELSGTVNEAAGTFFPGVEKESNLAEVKRYQGSTCYLASTVYYGVAYSYWVCF